jgi:integrase
VCSGASFEACAFRAHFIPKPTESAVRRFIKKADGRCSFITGFNRHQHITGGFMNDPYHLHQINQLTRALDARFGEGHYDTKDKYCDRIQVFCDFLDEYDINDLRQVSHGLVKYYAQRLERRIERDEIAISTATGYLSAVNVALAGIQRSDRCVVSPEAFFGSRSSVRTSLGVTLNPGPVLEAAAVLQEQGHDKCAITISANRFLGVRLEEAMLADYRCWYYEARRYRAVNVIEGTKGGRGKTVDRWVSVGKREIEILARAAALQGSARNLVPGHLSLDGYESLLRRQYEKVRYRFALTTFHELRAAFACEVYQILTRSPAPAIAGRRVANKEADRWARAVISYLLGHKREKVCAAYVGSAK